MTAKVQKQEAGSFAHHTPERAAETLRKRGGMLPIGANLSVFPPFLKGGMSVSPPFLKGGRGDFGY